MGSTGTITLLIAAVKVSSEALICISQPDTRQMRCGRSLLNVHRGLMATYRPRPENGPDWFICMKQKCCIYQRSFHVRDVIQRIIYHHATVTVLCRNRVGCVISTVSAASDGII